MDKDYISTLFGAADSLSEATMFIRRANVALCQYANCAEDHEMARRIDPDWVAQKAGDIGKLCAELLAVACADALAPAPAPVQTQAPDHHTGQEEALPTTPIKKRPLPPTCPGAPDRASLGRQRRLVLEPAQAKRQCLHRRLFSGPEAEAEPIHKIFS